MTLHRDGESGALLRKASGGLCTTCCEAFASVDCTCFLDPDPAAWSDATTYAVGACVYHDGWCYYGKLTDNLDNEPAYGSSYWEQYQKGDLETEPAAWASGTEYVYGNCVVYDSKNYYCKVATSTGDAPGTGSAYWARYYIGSTLSHWNSFSPYGGVGTTPRYFVVTFDIAWEKTSAPTRTQSLKGTIVVEIASEISPTCTYTGSGVCVFIDSEDGTFAPTLEITLVVAGGVMSATVTDYDGFNNAEFFISTPSMVLGRYCIFEKFETWDNTTGGGIYHEVGSCSYRPLDCSYTQYSASVNYAVSDCVSHDGKFWSCDTVNGPGTANGVQEPGNSTGYWTEIT